jgi:multidrug efflux system outer membrane protein
VKRLAPAALLLASACAVGPKYQRPEVATPPAWRFEVGPQEAASIADLPWWQVFRDPELEALIREALANNQDLRLAAARVEESRALVGVARADFYPQVALEAGGSYGQQLAKNYTPGVGPAGRWRADGGLSWELDVWGRVRNASDAAKASLLATEEGRRGVVLSLVSEVAQAYADLLELDQELEISRRNTETRQGTLDLFTKRSDGGIGNDLEVNQARADLAVTAAAIPSTERLIALKESQLAVLLGRPPGPIARTQRASFAVPPTLPMGVPAALLERRPDVRAAEDGVMASTSLVGVAVANRLPKLSLEGVIGLAGPQLTSMFTPEGLLWSVGGNLLAPIFQGGRLSSEEEAARARLEQSVATYRQSVLTAWREVADAAVSVRKLREVVVQEEVRARASRAAERLARMRYDGGVSSYLEVLDAQRSTFQSELDLVRVRRDEVVSIVQLYRALGGGWQDAPPAGTAAAATPAAPATAPAPAAR